MSLAAPGSRARAIQPTIAYAQPLPLGGAHMDNLSVAAEDYLHSIDAFGGFDSASFRLSEHAAVLGDWYENGLGRDIRSYDENLQLMWEGFVNQVTVRQAGYEITRGPLVNVQNRLQAIYSQIDTSTTPPTPGLRRKTGVVNHLESQARYGIWPRVLSLAGVTDPNAEQLRDSHLAQYAKPETRRVYLAQSNATTLTVDCLGYMHTLNYPYNQTSVTGTIELSAKLAAVLAANPNGWISSDLSRVVRNTLAVSAWENDDNLALGLIRGLTAMGDANDRRHLFGIYEERQAVYGPVPTDWTYEIRLGDPRRVVRNRAGGEVPDWAVRPGQWVFYSDFLPGLIVDYTDLRDDPRMLFIESVEFHMAGGLLLNGGKIDTVGQKLARLGLAGFSV